MKTKIFFACLTFCFAWQANAQIDFAPLGAEWYYTYTFGCCPENHFIRIVSEKDTVISGNNCRVIKQYYDNSNTVDKKYIVKQEKGRIYYFFQNKFHLLFDFDLEVNDTVNFSFMYKEYNDDFPSGKDTVINARFQVESIATNAHNLMEFTTVVLEDDILNFGDISVPPFSYYKYTETIGLLDLLGSPLHREFIPVFDNIPHPAMQSYRWIRCYIDTEFSLVSEEWSSFSLPCNYSIVTGFNTLKNEDIKIYPNPFSDRILLFTNNAGDIEIINISGKVVYSSKLSNGINEISTCRFLEGIYLVRIQNQDKTVQTFNIVKP